ncbi:endonuclease/exonuclease/phosphatase family protein [bacterium]|nr:endonuclease/exonuclease/phosphatase family protein [bacterium]
MDGNQMKSCLSAILLMLIVGFDQGRAQPPKPIRFATFNVSLAASGAGELIDRLKSGRDEQAISIAQIIRKVRPDVLLMNEFDYDPDGQALNIFKEMYLSNHNLTGSSVSTQPIEYAYAFSQETNTGVASGHDLDNDGVCTESAGSPDYARDCKGFGFYPGQYGMVLLSRLPIDTKGIRTFRHFRWKEMPAAKLPQDPTSGSAWYSPAELQDLPLSSKSHWDVPIHLGPHTIHVLASHPTPPVFDGPEDRNGCRNFDEIRFFVDFVQPERAGYIRDDGGTAGGLPAGSMFVVLGDLNSDPQDGDSSAVVQWFSSGLVSLEPIPASKGGEQASTEDGGRNAEHSGNPAQDTSRFPSSRGPGNLRLDYALSSKALQVNDAGVFWPAKSEDRLLHELTNASDHRLVWIDIEAP